ncbi:amidase [Aquibium carbonis]|uniref:Amidase n=1 Tax=Aquibium carbonis TaxID=2495581 RepID=A0A429Z251_9HYPH|nr:amidase [Aquibium carbonis]RST87782.1 amidase [Aquibium carbonis]
MDARASATPNPILGLGAVELRDRLARGALSAVDLAQACLDRIAAEEPRVQAWAWLDGDHVMAQARALDARRASGRAIGPLHGLPVGLKDIIDTVRIPTANGTVLDAGRVPIADAAVVERLKAAGAIIMGKTVSTELAFLHPGKTRNPHDPERTPGGSSSGSAAAVAAGMVPLALGTQTGGSVIRPAAFCGVVGFKPSFGTIARTGILVQSPSLDTVGVFARYAEDAALVADVLFGFHAADRATQPAPHPRLLDTASAAPPVVPTLAFVRPPGWEEAEDDTKDAFAELVEVLGERCFEAILPTAFAEASTIRERINFAEMAKFYYPYERRGRDRLSKVLQDALEAGKAIPARDYIAALDWPDILYAGLDEIFQRCDAIITPAAPGPAPLGLAGTGSAVFNGLWTLCGTPAVTLPLLNTGTGLPMGVQLVGRRGDDARLLRTARWLGEWLTKAETMGA